jgi:hypothetical protein
MKRSNKDEWITADSPPQSSSFLFIQNSTFHTGNSSHIHICPPGQTRSLGLPISIGLGISIPRPFLRAARFLACSLANEMPPATRGSGLELGWGGMKSGWCPGSPPCLVQLIPNRAQPRNLEADVEILHVTSFPYHPWDPRESSSGLADGLVSL